MCIIFAGVSCVTELKQPGKFSQRTVWTVLWQKPLTEHVLCRLFLLFVKQEVILQTRFLKFVTSFGEKIIGSFTCLPII
jgi:hypothetical protein